MRRSTAVIPRKGRSHFNIPIIHRRCKVATDPTAFFCKTLTFAAKNRPNSVGAHLKYDTDARIVAPVHFVFCVEMCF